MWFGGNVDYMGVVLHDLGGLWSFWGDGIWEYMGDLEGYWGFGVV